jgi:hypothetical protein
MVLRWHAIGVAVTVVAIAGCKGEAGRFEEPAGGAAAPAAPPTAEVPARAPTARALPPVIEKAEEVSEDVQDDIAKDKWDDASKKTMELRALSDSLKQTGAPPASVTTYDSAVATLAKNVESKNRVGAGLAANEASRAVISMMSGYSVKVPVEVGYMDVDARDVAYHAEAGDWSAAEKSAKDLQTNYTKVQPHGAQKNTGLDQKVRTEVEQLTAAVTQKNMAAVSDASKKVLDEIDNIERTY